MQMGAQAFSVICSYVLKVAKLAFCLSEGNKSFFYVGRIRVWIRIQGVKITL
jgi:hypothetical protein